jgi:hypothetical protein
MKIEENNNGCENDSQPVWLVRNVYLSLFQQEMTMEYAVVTYKMAFSKVFHK